MQEKVDNFSRIHHFSSCLAKDLLIIHKSYVLARPITCYYINLFVEKLEFCRMIAYIIVAASHFSNISGNNNGQRQPFRKGRSQSRADQKQEIAIILLSLTSLHCIASLMNEKSLLFHAAVSTNHSEFSVITQFICQ